MVTDFEHIDPKKFPLEKGPEVCITSSPPKESKIELYLSMQIWRRSKDKSIERTYLLV